MGSYCVASRHMDSRCTASLKRSRTQSSQPLNILEKSGGKSDGKNSLTKYYTELVSSDCSSNFENDENGRPFTHPMPREGTDLSR